MVVDRRVETPTQKNPRTGWFGGSVHFCAQALGRLPWFAPFFLRARRLRPVLPMISS
jgi:hypothetical protein